jgi:hypothetical protein
VQYPITIRIIYRLMMLVAVIALSGCRSDPPTPGSTLFQDDFSNPTSGWQVGEDASGSVAYQEGWFRFRITNPHAVKISTPGLKLNDMRIEVDATKIGGPDDNHFGILCRYEDENNFYFFTMSSDGYSAIGKYKDGHLVWLGKEQMQPNDAIQQGNNTNHLRADCIGDNLTFYLNGRLFSTAVDTDFLEGDAGLMTGSSQTAGVDVLFDNILIIAP